MGRTAPGVGRALTVVRKFSYAALAGVLTLVGLVGASPSSASAPSGVGCRFDGNLQSSPGLGLTPTNQDNYSLSGILSGCVSGDASTPTRGQFTSKNGPLGTTAGCAYSFPTTEHATITWGDLTATTSDVTYSIQSVGAAVVLQGSIDIGSTRYGGDTFDAVLAFSTTTPQACISGTLTNAAFTGSALLGTASS